MSGIVYGTAVFTDTKPGEIFVTRDGDADGEPFRGPATGPPRGLHLAPLPWAGVPGQAWAQDETGTWHIRVFRHEGDDRRPSRPGLKTSRKLSSGGQVPVMRG